MGEGVDGSDGASSGRGTTMRGRGEGVGHGMDGFCVTGWQGWLGRGGRRGTGGLGVTLGVTGTSCTLSGGLGGLVGRVPRRQADGVCR